MAQLVKCVFCPCGYGWLWGDDYWAGRFATVSPKTTLVFHCSDSNSGASETITVKNTSNSIIGYKIKATDTRRYQISSQVGSLKPGQNRAITIKMAPGSSPMQVCHDAFGVQTMPIQDNAAENKKDVNTAFRFADKSSVDQVRIQCAFHDGTTLHPYAKKRKNETSGSGDSEESITKKQQNHGRRSTGGHCPTR